MAQKKKNKTLAQLKKIAWKHLSEFIRRSAADEGGTNSCYTCGRLQFWRDSHAGHAIPGRTGATLLDASIIRVQCPICNVWKGGNYPVFTTKLIKENGMDWWEAKLAGARQIVKYTRSDLEELINTYKAKLETL